MPSRDAAGVRELLLGVGDLTHMEIGLRNLSMWQERYCQKPLPKYIYTDYKQCFLCLNSQRTKTIHCRHR